MRQRPLMKRDSPDPDPGGRGSEEGSGSLGQLITQAHSERSRIAYCSSSYVDVRIPYALVGVSEMKSKKPVFGSEKFRKNASGPIFVSRNIQNLYDNQLALRRVMRKMFFPAQISGILPLQAGEKIQVSFILCLWAAVTQCVMSKNVYDVFKLFLAGVSVSANATNASKDVALSYAEDSGKIIIVVYIVLSTTSFLWRRDLFDEISRRFLVCQLLLSQIGFQYNFRVTWKPLILHLPIVLACSLELIGGNLTSSPAQLFFRYSCEILVGSIVVIFVQIVCLSDEMLAYLNQQLLQMMSTPNHSGKFRKISVMSDCQHHLCSACQITNSLHSFPLVFLFLSIFIKTVVLIYKVIVVVTSVTAWKMLIYAFVLIAYVSRSWYVVYVCSQTAEQTRLFNKYLFEMILFESGPETLHIKKLMIHLEMKREIEFHAKGFFVIDYPLLHSIAAAATSYLVILVQTSSKK